MVDYAVTHEAAVSKLMDLVVEHVDLDLSWELWDTYVSEQPPDVAEALRRDPHFEAVRVASIWSRRNVVQIMGGPPIPAEAWDDIRRPGRDGFVGDRDEVRTQIASFFRDIEIEARRLMRR